MKKAVSFILAVFLTITLVGCKAKPNSDNAVLHLDGKTVSELLISTLPESESYKRTISSAAEIARIVDTINGMHLKKKSPENPNEYTGMTIVMEFCFADGSALEVYSFGNMFLKIGSAPWLRMDYDEAVMLENMVFT